MLIKNTLRDLPEQVDTATTTDEIKKLYGTIKLGDKELMADGTLKVGTITNSAGSGNITIGSGVTLLSNVPAFEAIYQQLQL